MYVPDPNWFALVSALIKSLKIFKFVGSLVNRLWNALHVHDEPEPGAQAPKDYVSGSPPADSRRYVKVVTTLNENRDGGRSFPQKLLVEGIWHPVKNSVGDKAYLLFRGACASAKPYTWVILAEIVGGGCFILSVEADWP